MASFASERGSADFTPAKDGAAKFFADASSRSDGEASDLFPLEKGFLKIEIILFSEVRLPAPQGE